jgi:hypothetical protein
MDHKNTNLISNTFILMANLLTRGDDMRHEITSGFDHGKVVKRDGVCTTVCENRYEIVVQDGAEMSEQQAVQSLRDWLRARNKRIAQQSRVMPE